MKLIFTVFAIFIFKFTYCQEITILDFNSNQPIENVSVSIDEKFIGYSDSNGNFNLKTDVKYSSINFSHLSYETLSIEREFLN